jgi:hypothetical protein
MALSAEASGRHRVATVGRQGARGGFRLLTPETVVRDPSGRHLIFALSPLHRLYPIGPLLTNGARNLLCDVIKEGRTGSSEVSDQCTPATTRTKRLGRDDVYQRCLSSVLPRRRTKHRRESEFVSVMRALEQALTECAGKTKRLNRTRQKLSRLACARPLLIWHFSPIGFAGIAP